VAHALPSPYAVLDPAAFKGILGNDFDWASGNIPLLDFPQQDINKTYYYRWRLFHEHMTLTPNGYTISEFLNRPPIPCAAGHHVAEGMWLRDEKVIDDVLLFWYEQGGDPSQSIYAYSNWIGWSAARRQQLVGNHSFSRRLLNGLVKTFHGYPERYLVNTTERRCWWQIDDRDGMEYSISGSGCRPTINSILYGEARAILDLAAATGNTTLVKEFTAWCDFAQQVVLEQLWNPETQTFAVIPIQGLKPVSQPMPLNQSCNLSAVRVPNQPVQVRELLGFVPWYFSTGDSPLIPYERGAEFGAMWGQLFDEVSRIQMPSSLTR
jgi:hypothetical protein